MDFSVASFSRLRPVPIRLARWTNPNPPVFREGGNPMRLVADFARHMGVSSLPLETVNKLRGDPYFKYCFYQLRNIIEDPTAIQEKDRLKDLLVRPDCNDSDVFLGLKAYLNNFPFCFPGQRMRLAYERMAEDYPSYIRRYAAIDRVLGLQGIAQALSLLEQTRLSPGKTSLATYFKFCLPVFDALVASREFTAFQLWA